ncbi:MAG: HAMP domain-containing protein [Spirochaetes bacterium]|nr:HAMP domain-containing protein [Spirochaetota bacterium]
MHISSFNRIARAYASDTMAKLPGPGQPASESDRQRFHEAAVSSLFAGQAAEARRLFWSINRNAENNTSLLNRSQFIRKIRGLDIQATGMDEDSQPCPYAAVRLIRGKVPVSQEVLDLALRRGGGLYAVCFSPEQVEGSVDNLVEWTTRLAAGSHLLGLYAINFSNDGPRAFAVLASGSKLDSKGLQKLYPLDGLPISVQPEELIPPGKARLIRHRKFVSVQRLPLLNIKSKQELTVDTVGQSSQSGPKKHNPGLLQARVRFPIGIKLGLVVSALLTVSLVTMNMLSSAFFLSDTTARVEENNHSIAQISAAKIEDDLRSITDRVQLLLEASGGDAAAPVVSSFYTLNPDILGVKLSGIFQTENQSSLAALGLTSELFDALPPPGQVESLTVFNATPLLGVSAIGLYIPYRSGGIDRVLSAYASAERYTEILTNRGIVQTFIVDANNRLLLHADSGLVAANPDYSANAAVSALRQSPLGNGQLRYRDNSGQEFLAAYRKLGIGNIGVISEAPTKLAFAAVDTVQRRNLLILGAILSLAALLVYFFSRTISNPVQMLMDAAILVERGHFDLDIQATTHDELGALSTSFMQMGKGLAEREKIKDAFGRFVNKSVAEMATKGEIKLGGERKQATIFFSDIRAFTAISEAMQPEQVVDFLNQYLTRMVQCVSQSGGVVDKFIGDAIMAVWGVPVSTGNDPVMAVDASLAMRASLTDFNKDRGTPDKPLIRIGCGLNTGPVISGQIGSNERMEYTVIGDTVNLASRIESLNKAFGTDILVSEYTLSCLGDRYRTEAMPMINVKGKAKPVRVYAILGRMDDPGAPATLSELRKRFGIEDVALDKNHIMDDEEEQKYTIVNADRNGAGSGA